MRVDMYRRYSPRIGIVRLVDGHSPITRPKYIGLRLNLWNWMIEFT